MKALLEKVRKWLCVVWDRGSWEEWASAASLVSSPLWCHPPGAPYAFLSLCDTPRYLQSSFVWTHEPWQRLMSSLWSRKRRNG